MSRSLSDLHPAFALKVQSIISDLEAAGYPVWLAETLRTAERQADLVRRKLSWTDHSRHQDGLAADLVDGRTVAGHLVLWGASMEVWRLSDEEERQRLEAAREFFAALGEAAHRHGVTWGGDWKRHYDPAHIEETP